MNGSGATLACYGALKRLKELGRFCVIVQSLVVTTAFALNAAQPTITSQPQSQTAIVYQQVALGVIASGTQPLSYQWRKNDEPIARATNDQLLVTHAGFADSGSYSVVVSNEEGSALSAGASLAVTSPMGGDLDYTFAWGGSIDDTVFSVAVQADGRVLIAGRFSTVNGTIRGGIARLNADGTTDQTFMSGVAGPNGNVYATALQPDGKMLIGGDFTTVHSLGRTNIARLNADGTLDSSFRQGLPGPQGAVSAIVVQPDGKLLVGGGFVSFNGVNRTNLVRLNPDGTLDSDFYSAPDGGVGKIVVQSDGKLLIAGPFRTINGVSRDRIARLNTDGTLDESFTYRGPGPSCCSIGTVALQNDGKVLITGYFEEGDRVQRIARLNTDGTLDSSFVGDIDNYAYSMAVQGDGKVLISGDFTSVNGVNRGRIARLNADGSLDTGFLNDLPGADYYVFSVAQQGDGKVLIGGWFTSVNNVGRKYIARLNADGSLDEQFGNGSPGANYIVSSVALQDDGKVLVGGIFSTVNGVSRNGIARLNPDGTLDTSFQNGLSGADGHVLSVVVQADGKVLLGGSFGSVNGVSCIALARLQPSGALDDQFLSGIGGGVGCCRIAAVVLQNDGKILIGGAFYGIHGVDRNSIARLNSDGTLDRSFLEGLSGANFYVNSIAVQADGKVLIGGNFESVNGSRRGGIARLNADGTLDSGFLSGLPGIDCCQDVNSIAVQSDGKVLIGGNFLRVNGTPRNSLARLNPDGSLDPGFQNSLVGADYAAVNSVIVQSGGRILIGGGFGSVNRVRRWGIARLNSDGSLDRTFENGTSPMYGIYGSVESMAVQADGKIVIDGQFTRVNGVPTWYVARIWDPPSIRTIIPIGAELILNWYAISNRTYRVQYKQNLSGDWTDLAGDVFANGGVASKTDTSFDGVARRFYRVLQLP